MIPQPRPELVLVAGMGDPPAAEATEAEQERRTRFERANPDCMFSTWAGCWIGNVRVRIGAGRNEYTAVRDTLTEVLDALETFAAELDEGGP